MKETRDYEKLGYEVPVRCWRCGTRKNPEDVGVWQEVEVEGKEGPNHVIKIWFHSQEDRDIWVKENEDRFVRLIE